MIPSNLHPYGPLLLILVLVIFGPIATITIAEAADRNLSDEQIEQIEARLEETRTRLNLTPEQQEALEPILRESLEKRLTVLQSHGFSQGNRPSLNFREKIALGKEMKAIRDETATKVSGILNEEQMAEFEKIQEERREQFRERLQAKS
ncbi:MAG: hypothetical protein MI867_25735 [Pseudomonadales bacterium]|nr:hypothetical protein [Pseudomonadales bacterium]